MFRDFFISNIIAILVIIKCINYFKSKFIIMTKSELLKMIELLPDDCEIKIKHNGALHLPIESGW